MHTCICKRACTYGHGAEHAPTHWYHPGIILVSSWHHVSGCVLLRPHPSIILPSPVGRSIFRPHPGIILLSLAGRLALVVTSWFHPASIRIHMYTYIYIYIYIFMHTGDHPGIILVSSWYHPGDRGIKCQHPGIILPRPFSEQCLSSKIEFCPEKVPVRECPRRNILAHRM